MGSGQAGYATSGNLAMVTPVAILNRFRSRSRSAARFRLGSLPLLLALGWPMILPGILETLAPLSGLQDDGAWSGP